MRKIKILIFLACFSFLYATTSYAQVKKHDKVTKVNRSTYNFSDQESCDIEKQKKDRSLQTVYSDQQDNICYLDELGLKMGEKQEFLTPYYVIDEKDDYVELVAKNPEGIGKPKGMFSFFYGSKYRFQDAKEEDYVGWMHKDNLLKFSTPRLSADNYKPLYYMVGYNNLESLYNSRKLAAKDSIFIYKDPKLKIKSDKAFNTNEFVFLYKYNKSKNAVLVSNKSSLSTTDTINRTMGWIPSELITPVGQKEVIHLDEIETLKVAKNNPTNGDIPVIDIAKNFVFKNTVNCGEIALDSVIPVTVPLHVWNHNDNKLINVLGNDLLIKKVAKIKEENASMNFHFIFDCSPELRSKLMLQIASLQHIWVLLSEDARYKNIAVSFSASSFGCGDFYSLEKTNSFIEWVNHLQNVFIGVEKPTETNTEGISKNLDFALERSKLSPSFENNFIIIVGEDQLDFSVNRNSNLIQDLAETSSKILFFQLENKPDNRHQNYILQAKRILDTVGNTHARFLKDYTVDNKLVKQSNIFTKLSLEEDNAYLYDAPKNSVYNGGLVFPKINQQLTPSTFDATIDSLLERTFTFNTTFLASLERNAAELGFLRSKPTNSLTKIIERDNHYKNLLPLIPKNQVYEQYFVQTTTSEFSNDPVHSGYLLSKEDIDLLSENYQSLIPSLYNKVGRKERKKLTKIYKKTAKGLNGMLFYKVLNKRNSIGDLLYIKTGIPVSNEALNSLRIKDTHKKSKLSHEDFRKLMNGLRTKIEALENTSEDTNTVYKDGSNKIYYYLSKENLL